MVGSAYGCTMVKSKMMKKNRLPNNDHPLAKALIYSIVLFAVTHLTISFFAGIMQGDPSLINMFHVLGFDLIWPELGIGSTNAFIAAVMVVAVWVILSIVLLNREKRFSSEKTKK